MSLTDLVDSSSPQVLPVPAHEAPRLRTLFDALLAEHEAADHGPVPVWLARVMANWREGVFRRKNKTNPPLITQAQLKFAGLNLDTDTRGRREMRRLSYLAQGGSTPA